MFGHNKWDKHLISSKKDVSRVPMFVSHNGTLHTCIYWVQADITSKCKSGARNLTCHNFGETEEVLLVEIIDLILDKGESQKLLHKTSELIFWN